MAAIVVVGVAVACVDAAGVVAAWVVRVTAGVVPAHVAMARVEAVAVAVCVLTQQVLRQQASRWWGVVVACVLTRHVETPPAHTQSGRQCRQSGTHNPAGRGWHNHSRGDWVGMLSLLCPGEGGGAQAEWDTVGA